MKVASMKPRPAVVFIAASCILLLCGVAKMAVGLRNHKTCRVRCHPEELSFVDGATCYCSEKVVPLD